MTYNNVKAPEPTVWLIEEAFVTHKGNEYRFWAELDGRDGQVSYEFIDGEPIGDSFDWEEFDKDVSAMLNDYGNFCEVKDVEPEPYQVGEMIPNGKRGNKPQVVHWGEDYATVKIGGQEFETTLALARALEGKSE